MEERVEVVGDAQHATLVGFHTAVAEFWKQKFLEQFAPGTARAQALMGAMNEMVSTVWPEFRDPPGGWPKYTAIELDPTGDRRDDG